MQTDETSAGAFSKKPLRNPTRGKVAAHAGIDRCACDENCAARIACEVIEQRANAALHIAAATVTLKRRSRCLPVLKHWQRPR